MKKNTAKKKQTIFWSAAAVILMICIFCFSAQNGAESGRISLKVSRVLARIMFFRFGAMDAGQQTFIVSELNFFVRKLAHFSVYTALGMLVYTAVLSSGVKIKHKRLCSLAVCALYACADEVHQYFIPDRSMRLRDVLIDSVGSLFGIIFISVVVIVYLFFKDKKSNK